MISKLSVHSDAFEYAIKLEPALLFYDGNFLSDGCKLTCPPRPRIVKRYPINHKTEHRMTELKKKSLFDTIIDGIAGIFLPFINLLTAAGILKGILAVLTMTDVVVEGTATYLVLHAISDSVFYFLPLLIGHSAAKKFGANPYTALILAAILVYPDLADLLTPGVTFEVFGMPLKGVTYASSVLPIIMAVALLYFVEKGLKKVLPEVIQGFLIPLLSLLFVTFVTLAIFGPVGMAVSDAMAVGYEYVYSLSPLVAGFILGFSIQAMVIIGLQWGFLIVAMNNLALTGSDTILPMFGPAIFAQVGAIAAVMLKTKDKKLKSLGASAMVSALFGIGEPAIFGITLPRKKPFLAVLIGGGIGGAITGAAGTRAMAFAFPSLASLPVYYGPGFTQYVLSCVLATVIAFGLTMVMKFQVDLDTPVTESAKDKETQNV